MYFLPHDINSLLADVDRQRRDDAIEEAVAQLTPRIAAKKNEYRHFGPYWWWVKPLMQDHGSARRSWLRGGYTDRVFLKEYGNAQSDLPITMESDGEGARWLAWLGFRYFEMETVDDTPAGFHIVQRDHQSVAAYTVFDADASEQLQLFSDESDAQESRAEFIADPTRYTGGAWFRRADEYATEGHYHRAAAALRRAVQRAVDESDRTRAWIRLGELFQEMDHVRKALFCYYNAYRRDREGWIQGLMGDAWLQLNDPYEAIQCFQAALQAMPGNPEYQAGMERARKLIDAQGTITAAYRLRPERLAR